VENRLAYTCVLDNYLVSAVFTRVQVGLHTFRLTFGT